MRFDWAFSSRNTSCFIISLVHSAEMFVIFFPSHPRSSPHFRHYKGKNTILTMIMLCLSISRISDSGNFFSGGGSHCLNDSSKRMRFLFKIRSITSRWIRVCMCFFLFVCNLLSRFWFFTYWGNSSIKTIHSSWMGFFSCCDEVWNSKQKTLHHLTRTWTSVSIGVLER